MAEIPDNAPTADVVEQREEADGLPDNRLAVDTSAEAAEGDLVEQAQSAEAVQAVLRSSPPPDVDEADWMDQNVVELDPDGDDGR
jgi:hypothetical protein